MSADFEFDLGPVLKKLSGTVDDARIAATLGVQDAAYDLLQKSRDIAPLKEGTLRLTAFADIEEENGEVTGSVIYSAVNESASGERYNYALRTHEMAEYKNPTTPGTGPKYLERPLKTNAKRYNRMIADALRRGLRNADGGGD